MAGTVNLTGTLQNILGVADAGGSITVNLANYDGNIPRVIGTGLLVQPSITVVASNGTFSITGLYRNDLISPANTFYEITFISDTGVRVKQAYPPFKSDGSFDLSTLTPLNTTVPVAPTTAIFTSNSAGLTPASGGGSTNFLRADGVFAAPGGAGFTPFTPISHQFLTGVNGSGVFSSAQLAAADLSNGVTGTGGFIVLSTSPNLTTPDIGIATGTSLAISGAISAAGSTGLPSSTGAVPFLFSQQSTPHGGGLLIGDGSGWQFDVIKRSSSTNTILMSFKDSGVLAFGASSDAGFSRTGAGIIAIGNGSVGNSSGTAQASQFVATPDAGTTSLGRIDSLGLGIGSSGVMRFSSTSGSGGTADSGLSRVAAGQVALGNGTQGDFSGRLYTSTANTNVTPVTVTGTTSQTALQAVTLLTGELNSVGRWITVKARGVLSAGSTAGSWTLTLKMGSTTLATTTVNPGATTTNIPWWFEVEIMTQTAGASGAVEVHGTEILTGQTSFAFVNTGNPVSGIDLTGAPTLTLFCTNTQTTTSCTSRIMGYQRNN